METTLNIDCKILEDINRAALMKGISRSELIVVLIKKMIADIKDPSGLGRMVQYQKRNKLKNWHTFHVRLRADDYEYFLDLRKLLKMSVSLILAYSVKKYLKSLNVNYTDNYLFRNYIVVREIIDNVISWRFIWGFPRNIEGIIRF